MVIFKNILLFLFFSTYLLAQEDFTPLEQCTYENEKFWIKILNLCPEGNITCDKLYMWVSIKIMENILS